MSSFRVDKDRVSMISDTVKVVDGKLVAAPKKKPEPAPQAPASAAAAAPGGASAPQTPAAPVAVPVSNEKEKQELRAQAKKLEDALKLVSDLNETAKKAKADAQAEAKRIIADAEAQAQKKIADAAVTIEKETEAGRQRGYDAGLAQAEEAANVRKTQEARELQAMIDEIRAERQRIIDALEPEIVETVLEIAQKVLHSELRNKEAFLDIVRNEIGILKQTDSITVSVAVNDFLWLFKSAEEVKEAFPDGNVSFVADKELAEGDCIIETEAEVVDCGVNHQMEKAVAIVRGELEEE